MKSNKSNKAFTLVEILIVIAIIGLLAAIAIPNFVHARDVALAKHIAAVKRADLAHNGGRELYFTNGIYYFNCTSTDIADTLHTFQSEHKKYRQLVLVIQVNADMIKQSGSRDGLNWNEQSIRDLIEYNELKSGYIAIFN
jgi:prepilin-type N-terminal cleavage/methylation domain-containing protein